MPKHCAVRLQITISHSVFHWVIPWLAHLVHPTKGLHGSNKFRNVVYCFPPHPALESPNAYSYRKHLEKSCNRKTVCFVYLTNVFDYRYQLTPRWALVFPWKPAWAMVHSKTVPAAEARGSSSVHLGVIHPKGSIWERRACTILYVCQRLTQRDCCKEWAGKVGEKLY